MICNKYCINVIFMLTFVRYSIQEKEKKGKPVASEHCYGELGCLKTSLEWYDKKLRPVNKDPENPYDMRTRFFLFKKGHCDKKGIPKGNEIILTEEGLKCVHFSNELETKILIHDFTSSGDAGWMKHFMKSMFAKGEWNVIVVDWGSGAEPPFLQAIANARLVSLQIIFMLDLLMDKVCLRLEDVHVIGHGLGAHIAGYVGEELSGLGRITGLDPTGLHFEGMPPVVRLDESDALYVDVIHTDGEDKAKLHQGTMQPLGHVDFYPNGGSAQPGCTANHTFPPLDKLKAGQLSHGQVLPGCSHKRAFKYFIETVCNVDCPFVGFPCTNYTDLLAGTCMASSLAPHYPGTQDDKRSVMGLISEMYHSNGDPPHRRYFLETSDTSQFCLFPYMFVVNLAHPPKAKTHVEGRLFVRLHQQDVGLEINLTPKEKRFMAHGTSQTFFAYSPTRVGVLDHLEMKWEYHSSASHASAVCVLCNDSLFVANVTVISFGYYPPKNQTTVMCNQESECGEVKNGQTELFVKCDTKKKPKTF